MNDNVLKHAGVNICPKKSVCPEKDRQPAFYSPLEACPEGKIQSCESPLSDIGEQRMLEVRQAGQPQLDPHIQQH